MERNKSRAFVTKRSLIAFFFPPTEASVTAIYFQLFLNLECVRLWKWGLVCYHLEAANEMKAALRCSEAILTEQMQFHVMLMLIAAVIVAVGVKPLM